MLKQIKSILIATSITVLLASCSSNNLLSSTANAMVAPSTDINFHVSTDINPDFNNRPSPVVVTLFELSSRTAFDTQDFFSLYEDAELKLGPDLIKKQELELQPNKNLSQTLELNKNSRFVGVIVAYRDIDKSRWKAVTEVDPTGYDNININIEKLAVYIAE